MNKPIVIGVIGGIASGKSEVTRLLEAVGAKIISADQIGHRVLLEQDVIASLVKIFGPSILKDCIDGESTPSECVIDRKKLGAMVFGESEAARALRKQLEAIVHPRIRQIAKAELLGVSADATIRMVVLDAPLLIEGGWLPYCDRVLFVDSPETMRRQRAVDRGWTEEQWRDRESAQLSLAEKKQHATDVLSNDGSMDQLKQKVDDLVNRFQL